MNWRREMANITDAVLATTLKELIADEMIHRKQFDEIPPRVEYCLTEKGNSVVPILRSICGGQEFIKTRILNFPYLNVKNAITEEGNLNE